MPLFASVRSALAIQCQGPTDLASHQCLADLKAWRQSNIPIYSFTEHQRLDETKYLYGVSIIISVYQALFSDWMRLTRLLAEGILVLHDQKLRDLYDLKVNHIQLAHHPNLN